jgi:hypothetical protein
MEKRQEYLATIQRELDKRDIAYSKMLLKAAKKVEENLETPEYYNQKESTLKKQFTNLKEAALTIQLNSKPALETAIVEIKELVREMDMRLRYYPMMIMRHMISKDDAEKEKKIWRELIEYFNEKYCPSVEVKFLKTRCRIINNP